LRRVLWQRGGGSWAAQSVSLPTPVRPSNGGKYMRGGAVALGCRQSLFPALDAHRCRMEMRVRVNECPVYGG
jgi:hypothetical protein